MRIDRITSLIVAMVVVVKRAHTRSCKRELYCHAPVPKVLADPRRYHVEC
jgi:hypothetical protein